MADEWNKDAKEVNRKGMKETFKDGKSSKIEHILDERDQREKRLGRSPESALRSNRSTQ